MLREENEGERDVPKEDVRIEMMNGPEAVSSLVRAIEDCGQSHAEEGRRLAGVANGVRNALAVEIECGPHSIDGPWTALEFLLAIENDGRKHAEENPEMADAAIRILNVVGHRISTGGVRKMLTYGVSRSESNIPGGLAEILVDRGMRVEALRFIRSPSRRDEICRTILSGYINEVVLLEVLCFADDPMLKVEAADRLFEKLSCDLPSLEGVDVLAERHGRELLVKSYAHILMQPCRHQREALDWFFVIPWDYGNHGHRKDSLILLVLLGCKDVSILEAISHHVLSRQQTEEILWCIGPIVVAVSSCRDTAWERLERWCRDRLPAALAPPRSGGVASDPSARRWDAEVASMISVSCGLDYIESKYPPFAGRVRALKEDIGLAGP